MSDGPPPNPVAIAEFGNFGKYGVRDEKVAERDDRSEEKPNIEYDADGIHDGLVFPTEEERATLRRVPDSIPWNAYREPPSILSALLFLTKSWSVVIAVIELAERFSVCLHFFSPYLPVTKEIVPSSMVPPSSS